MLRLSLNSLELQSFKDFEVIVFDNSDVDDRKINKVIVDQISISNLRYIVPSSPVNMCDSWESALKQATGRYQGILSSKFLFYRFALQNVYDILQHHNIDIINHSYDLMFYSPGDFFKYKMQYPRQEKMVGTHFKDVDVKEIVARKLSFEIPIFQEDRENYVAGKISYGFYKAELIDRLRERYQRIFHPLSCDYTSAILALHEAKQVVFLPQSLQVNIVNFKGSNGLQTQTIPGAMFNFLKETDPSLSFLDLLPIPQLYFSLHNACGYDYEIINRLSGKRQYEICAKNLLQRCLEDFQRYPFSSLEELDNQRNCIIRYADQHQMQIPFPTNDPPPSVYNAKQPFNFQHLRKGMYGRQLGSFLS